MYEDYGACHYIGHAGAHVGDQEGRVDAEAVEDVGRFGANRSLAGGDGVGLALGVQQSGIADRRAYGVGVGVLMSENVDRPLRLHVISISFAHGGSKGWGGA